MNVVCVNFRVKPAHRAPFHDAVLKQARDSLHLESDCQVFDVFVKPDDPCEVMLYEVYTDRAAFDAHCTTDHFHSFSTTVAPWVDEKRVTFWHPLEIA